MIEHEYEIRIQKRGRWFWAYEVIPHIKGLPPNPANNEHTPITWSRERAIKKAKKQVRELKRIYGEEPKVESIWIK